MENKKRFEYKFWLLVAADTIAGLAIAFLDSSPGWDDTGITAGLILVTSAVCGFVYQRKLWLWAILTGLWIPMYSIVRTGDFMFLIIFLISFAGSYGGGLIGRKMRTK